MNPITKVVGITLALAGLLSQTACSQSSVTITLGLIDASVETYLDNADPQYAAIVNPYLTAANTGVQYALTEWKTTDSAELKFTKIAAAFSQIAKPIFPNGTPATLIANVGLVSTAIEKFLATLQTTSAVLSSTPAGAEAFTAAAASPKALKLTRGDKQALPKIADKNAKLKARLKQGQH